MDKYDEFEGVEGLTSEDFLFSSVDLLGAAEQIESFIKERDRDGASDAIIRNPILAIGLVLLARLETLHYGYMKSQYIHQRLLSELIESVDCAGVIAPAYWMQSEVAAKRKAEELGIQILPEYSMADLRYLIDCKINEVL